MPRTTTELEIEQAMMSRERWVRRAKRAVNAIDKLDRKLKRLAAKLGKPAAAPRPRALPPEEAHIEQLAAEYVADMATTGDKSPDVGDLSIPTFLRREKKPLAAETVQVEDVAKAIMAQPRQSDAEVAAGLEEAAAERKRRKSAGRIAAMKAKQSGETKRMPLTGKAALEAIRQA